MSKHTPGPWKVDYDFGSDRPEIRSYDERLVSVCARQYPMSQKTCEANARLIAAAPEMLDAIRAHCEECAYFKATDAARCRDCKFKELLKKVEDIADGRKLLL